MKNSFIIPQKLPSLNDYICKCRSSKYEGSRYKNQVEYGIKGAILAAQAKGELKPTSKPIFIFFHWHEKTKRRDADNIASAKKFILDAMQKMGIIPNDNRKFVKGFFDTIVDDKEDYVEVELVEVNIDPKDLMKIPQAMNNLIDIIKNVPQ